MKIYLAGPLFTLAEKNFNAALAACLRSPPFEHEVWLPQEHDQESMREAATFRRDKKAIDLSDVVVANMDGPDPDSGTCWECGYAYGRDIPVVVFRTDWRSQAKAGPNSYNLMMTQAADERLSGPFAGVADLATQIDGAISRAVEGRQAVNRAASAPNNRSRKSGKRRTARPAPAPT